MEGVNCYLDLDLSGFLFADNTNNLNRLERKLDRIQGEGNYAPILKTLKESNPSSYRHLRRMIRVAYRKAIRESRYN